MSSNQRSTDRAHPTPSMSDVAALAGVALGTVSNALNNPHKVASATLDRIQSAIDELGFVRNDQARFLARGRSTTLGLIVTDISNSFFVDIARGAEEGASEHGLTTLLANSDNSREKQSTYLDLFHRSRYAGVLLTPFEAAPEQAIHLRRRGLPLVVLNVQTPPEEGCSIVVDNERGGYLAARHLIETGRRRLLFVTGPDRLDPLRQRRLGVERAVAETNGGAVLEEIQVDAVNAPQGRRVGDQILSRAPDERPDGVVAASDLLALGVVQSVRGDILIPRELAVIGYDNNSAVRESAIPLSTIAQPGHEMGACGAALLNDEVTDPHGHQHQALTLEPSLLARASTG